MRRRILRSFESPAQPVTAPALAQELDAPLSEVTYHLVFLVRSGAVELGEVVGSRAASMHLYHLTSAGQAEWVRAALDAWRERDEAILR